MNKEELRKLIEDLRDRGRKIRRKDANCTKCKNIPDHQHESSGSPYAISEIDKLRKLSNNVYMCPLCKEYYYYEQDEYGEALNRITSKFIKHLEIEKIQKSKC